MGIKEERRIRMRMVRMAKIEWKEDDAGDWRTNGAYKEDAKRKNDREQRQ